MESAIRRVIADFDRRPMQAARAMRGLLEKDPTVFFQHAVSVLRNERDSGGYTYLLTLLLSQGLLLKVLCDPEIFSLEEAIRIAQRMLQVDPKFDVRLVRGLLPADGKTPTQQLEQIVGTATGIQLLDILSEISDGTRILSTMTQLLEHPNSRIRSKAALLVGRSNKNHKWVQERMGEPDARVRANAVESLWGSDTAGCRAVFWTALGDDDNRVVGNAALGLYRLGDPASIRVIMRLLEHTEAGFRVSAVWVMGESGDPRFIPILTRILSEPSGDLRGNVLRAIPKLKKALAKRETAAPLSVHTGAARRGQDQWIEVVAAVQCVREHQIPELNSTNFAIWEDSALIKEYSVRQRGKHEPIAVALALPRITNRVSGAQEIQDLAVERALRHKRRFDLWMVLKYITPDPDWPVSPPAGKPYNGAAPPGGSLSPGDEDLSALRMRFTSNAEEISDAVASPGTRLACAADPLQAARTLLHAAAHTRAARNVIFVCQSEADALTPEVLEAARAAERANIAVHVITCRPDAIAAELCSRTGGILSTPSSREEIPEALESVCAGLLHTYELRYQPENPRASTLRLQVFTDTLIGEGLQPIP